MQRQLKLLVRLIDDLLDIARINRGKLTVQRTATTLRAVLDSAIETAMPLLLADRHMLDVRVPDEEIALYADHDRLSQVFSNLLNNAAKYSPADTPIELVARSDGDEHRRSRVIDSGIGLAPGQADEIFEVSRRSITRSSARAAVSASASRWSSASSSCMAAASSCTARGSVSGSRFTVRAAAGADSGRRRDRRAAHRGRRTALPRADRRRQPRFGRHDGDDAADARPRYANASTIRGETIAAVESFEPDIVFLDIGMPGLSGYDVARRLRAHAGAQLTLVAVTGWGHAEDRRRTAAAGFDHHLVKPADMAAISSICNS